MLCIGLKTTLLAHIFTASLDYSLIKPIQNGLAPLTLFIKQCYYKLSVILMGCIMTLTTEKLNKMWTDITNNDYKSSEEIIKKINALIKGNPDDCATAIDSKGRTLLYMAATIGDNGLVQQLIDKGADVNKQVTYTRLSNVMLGVAWGFYWISPPSFGALMPTAGLVIMLIPLALIAVAFLSSFYLARNDYLSFTINPTPLSQAVNHKHAGTVEILLKSGADVSPILYGASEEVDKVVRKYKAYMEYANEHLKSKNIGAHDLGMSAAEINIAKYKLGENGLEEQRKRSEISRRERQEFVSNFQQLGERQISNFQQSGKGEIIFSGEAGEGIPVGTPVEGPSGNVAVGIAVQENFSAQKSSGPCPGK